MTLVADVRLPARPQAFDFDKYLEIQGLESSMKKFFYNDITLGLPL